MSHLEEVHVAPESLDRFAPLIGGERVDEAKRVARALGRRLAGRVVWNVNSTARGGGVAEMLPPLLSYARGADIDVRWLVIAGSPPFFQVTKRLHHALHGSAGDGTPLDEAARGLYETTLHDNAQELLALVRPGDVVLLHDPQTAGLAPALDRHRALVVWRCHVGVDTPNEETERAWHFLEPYLAHAATTVYSRRAYVPSGIGLPDWEVIPPSIDPFSPKNQDLDPAAVQAILVHAGLVDGMPGEGVPGFRRGDGTPGRVDRQADVLRHGPPPGWETPLVVQVSRWDPLKDPIGVVRGFADGFDQEAADGAHLVLAGPNVSAVSDDPEGAAAFEAVVEAWRALPHAARGRVHLASLPMADVEENAAIVNALQRHATVVVQKSRREGFGLTVTEAMWKARPVVASAVGGIRDQIVDGESGLLVEDPDDLPAFGALVRRLLADREEAARLGVNARERVRDGYLGVRHLLQYAELLTRLDAARGLTGPAPSR